MDQFIPVQSTVAGNILNIWTSLVHGCPQRWAKNWTRPDFQTLPKTFSQLIPAASGGPVITVNASEARCDALILLPDLNDVLHIPLPNLTLNDVHQLHRSLYSTLKNKKVLQVPPRGGRIAPSTTPEEEFEIILAQLWTGIVKPILDGMAIVVCTIF